jgi:hypothetical protein
VAIDVGEVGAAGGLYENGESAGPFVHPVHRHAAEERGLGAEVKFGGTRMIRDEAFFFALVERMEFGAVDSAHGDKGKIAGMTGIGKR